MKEESDEVVEGAEKVKSVEAQELIKKCDEDRDNKSDKQQRQVENWQEQEHFTFKQNWPSLRCINTATQQPG